MEVTELDTIRAEKMQELLNEEGEQYIWQYDIMPTKQAVQEAIYNYNFDNMFTDLKKPYCLVGQGIDDCPFSTVKELIIIIKWLCSEGGYLGCYAKPKAQLVSS